jgi:hypothetical protein
MTDAALQKEALRQQMLLRALWRDARPAVVNGWLRDGAKFERGLEAYRANAGALSERALGAVFPTVSQLLGEESFAALARAFWRARPPERGDVGEWGEGLADFIDADGQLADTPYVADVARLEWALHRAERAADADGAPSGIERLGSAEPEMLRLVLRAGCALIVSSHPVVTIWHAHRSDDRDRFAPVRAAFAQGRAETAFVFRRGWQAGVQAIGDAEARFAAALLAGRTLAAALDAGGADFDFEPWLIGALQSGVLVGVMEDPR